MATRPIPQARSLRELFPPTAAERRYWELLGRLIEYVSLAELALNMVVVNWSGVDFETAKALFLPLRIDAATGTLNRIIETKKLRGRRVGDLKEILQQLGEINRARNDLVHLGARPKRGGFKVSNEMFARSRLKLRRVHLSFRSFDQMDADLEYIIWKLLDLCGALDQGSARPSPSSKDMFIQALARGVKKGLQTGQHGAWNYKPQQQAVRRRKSRGKPQAQRPPQKSSRE